VSPGKVRVRKRVILAPIILIALILSIFFSLPLLFATPTVAQSDCIIHVAIDSRLSGDRFVAKLYSEGIARHVVCASSQASWDIYPADFAREHLIQLGVDQKDVAALRLPMVDCGAQNRPIVIDYLKRNGWKSALLVVDPSLTRATRWSIVRDFKKSGIDLVVAFDPAERDEMLAGWWHTHWKAQRVVLGIMNSMLDQLYPECR